MPEAQQPISGKEWFSTPVSLRPTSRRKAKLAAIAKALGPDASPFDAIEASIDIAHSQSSGGGAMPSALADISDAIGRLAAERAIREEAILAAIEAAASLSKRTLDLISAATSSADGDAEDDDSPSLLDWLDGALAANGLKAQSSAAARAQWIGASMETARLATMRFEVSLAAVDGRIWASKHPEPAVALARSADIAGPLFSAMPAMAGRNLLVAFQRGARGNWAAALFHANEDGSFGTKIAALGA